MEGYHSSVLLKEAVDALIPTRFARYAERARQARSRQDGLVEAGDGWYLDCTLGDGGHSLEIIRRGGKVVGIDVDPESLERVRRRFEEEGISKDKFRLILGNFRDLNLTLQAESDNQKSGRAKLNLAGAIFDLGVSSLQFETPHRGFSFAKEGPLDMRMDPSLQVQAWDLLNNLSRKEIYELFHKLGEEKYSWRLADAVVRAREVRPITKTEDLAKLVVRVVGKVGDRKKIHPATRVFQALRIAVNDELTALVEGLDQVKELIEKDGHIVVISFHSLEDRIVKNTFRKWNKAGEGIVLTKKPISASKEEIAENPRARSAKMRVFEKM